MRKKPSNNFAFRLFFLFILLGLFQVPDNLSGQEYILSGRILDRKNSEALTGANLVEIKSGKGCVAGEKGRYSIRLTSGRNNLRISYIGFQDVDTSLIING
ncbi:MAG: carboxypeptidase-like regulatory domain-containing protein, partial [Bacteroidales bacterium]|nr:carboxypeptidase-like regulatory domain-containing protein [Bacteroidales bacterium]